MLTLKVVNFIGCNEIHTDIFSASRISHVEITTSNSRDYLNHDPDIYIGDSSYLDNKDNEYKEMVYSIVRLMDKDSSNVETIAILPDSTCYIMQDGKTCDTFTSRYFRVTKE